MTDTATEKVDEEEITPVRRGGPRDRLPFRGDAAGFAWPGRPPCRCGACRRDRTA